MLMHPDPTRFEQIRAQWGAVQQGEGESTDMVGRRLSQQPMGGDAPPNTTSKFRRTLSHGLAFISNPLSQRKTTPQRQAGQNPALAVTAPDTNKPSHHCDTLTSPTRDTAASKDSIALTTGVETIASHENPSKSADVNATLTALPRSRTTSFLPRPARSAPDANIIDSRDKTIKIEPAAIVTDRRLHAMKSKIPTPSPPLSERRVSSPRQYIPQNTSRRANYVGGENALVGDSAGSPSKIVARSRTTPNLVKMTHSLQPVPYKTPNKPGHKSRETPQASLKSDLQENIPTSERIGQRHSQSQITGAKRESLASSMAVANRASFVRGSSLVPNKQANSSTPLTTKKRLSSNLAQQTPITARRVHPQSQEFTPREKNPIAQPRLMVPRNPPTPTPLQIEAAGSNLPRSNTEKDLQRKNLGTPNGLGGIWRSSRALAAANHEVRLPRSFTFHNLRTSSEGVPPVPTIPDQYRTPSLSTFFQPASSYEHHRYRMASTAASSESIPEEKSHDVEIGKPSESAVPGRTGHSEVTTTELSDSSVDDIVHPSLTHQKSLPTLSSTATKTGVQYTQNKRPWSISDQQSEERADIEPHFQVRDYMPPLYWAGRFQSRYDHWRTEVMMAELDPAHVPTGQLGQCKLSQDKLAACYIFAQLRDLCLTEQAANSLWEFEFKYRRDNKLLGAEYPMQPPRKHDDLATDNKGAFGRAVRKLTPRKSSFVNLLKGKGWAKGDEAMPQDAPDHRTEGSSDHS